MKLYYTVSSAPEDVQLKPDLSLGGYKSSTPMPSSELGNMFGDISMYTVKNGNQNQYIGLIAKNELDVDIENIKVWFTFNTNCYSLLKISAIDLSVDSDGNYMMERVKTIFSKPIYSDFKEASTEETAVDLGSLLKGEFFGIWIERSLLLDKIKEDQEAIYQKDPSNPYYYNEIVLDKTDEIALNISYDEVIETP